MINGFLVEITNHSSTAQTVALFREAGLPEGVTVTTVDEKFDYEALLSTAIREGFMGDGFMTTDEIIKEVVLCREKERTHLPLNIVLNDQEMVIDGGSNYVTIMVPANEVVVFQLLPVLK